MKKTVYKIFGIALSLLMVLSLIPVSKLVVHAQEELVNVALKGQVTVSRGSGKDYVIDGNTTTAGDRCWDSGGVNFKKGESASLILDLQKIYDLEELKIFTYPGNVYGTTIPREYRYTLFTSNDNSTWKEVGKKSEGISLPEGDFYDISEQARYLKVQFDGGNAYHNGNQDLPIMHLLEIEAWAKNDPNEVSNVALHKPVEASVDNTSYPAKVITDGKTNGAYWDGAAAPAYYEIDLEDFYHIDELCLFPYVGGGRGYHYNVYASDNGIDYHKIAEKTNDEPATSLGETYTITDDVVARYIRVVMTYNTLAATSNNKAVHMYETQVFGTKASNYVPSEPSKVDPLDSENIAYHKPTTANMNKKDSSLVVDGMNEYGWSAKLYPSNVEVDLGKAYNISEIILHFPLNDAIYKYSIYGSVDGVDYQKLYRKSDNEFVSKEGELISLTNTDGIRYIRVNVEYNSESANSVISEIKVHGVESDVATKDKKDKYELTPFTQTQYANTLEIEDLLNGIVERTVGSEYIDWFTFVEVPQIEEGKDFYRISNENGKIKIEGTSGVAIASGLNYYYKYYCNVNISEVASQTKMPESIIPVDHMIEKVSPYKVRYAFNYCTLSYSFPYYDLEDWQHELDWLALNGTNVVLDLAGQEAVWVLFLQDLGYSFEDAKNWLAGPGYYAWQFMDNLEYINGPVPEGWIEDRVELARSTIQWKTSMGMQTVMQGYAGMLPTNIEDFIKDPEIIDNLLPQGQWGGLDRPWMVRTDSIAYETLAEKFYEAQEIVYGKNNHYYAVDPFHEGGIRPNDLTDDIIAREVLENLVDKYDEDAVWLIQHWWSNPSDLLLEGIGEYREDHAMILNLTSVPNTGDGAGTTGIPDNHKFKNTPWVYCMLESYGGQPGLDADLETLSKIPKLVEEKENTTLQGIGIISEATLDVPVAYDMLWEMAWEDNAIDLDEWIANYITRRYGMFSENAYDAWMILKETVYSRSRGVVHGFANKGPDLSLGMDNITYSTAQLEKALVMLLEDYDILSESEGYLFDISELAQQVIENRQYQILSELKAVYDAKDVDSFKRIKEELLSTFDLMDSLAGMNKSQLLGEWIGKATDFAKNYDDFSVDMFTINAKAMITTWKNSINTGLVDYSGRNFNGLIKDLYKEVWSTYLNELEEELITGVKAEKPNKYEMYWEWVLKDNEYTRETLSSTKEIKDLMNQVLEEIEVDETDLTLNAKVEASKEVNSPDSNGGYAKYVIDQNLNSYWDGGSVNDNPEIILDFKDLYDLERTQIIPYYKGTKGRYYHYEVYVSKNGKNWKKVAEKQSDEIQTQEGETYLLNGVSARYLKIVGKYNSMVETDPNNDSFHIAEWKVNGTLSQKVDTSKLIKVIKEAEAKLEATDIDNYTEASVEALESALDKAKALTDTATQEEVNEATKALTDAMNNLELKKADYTKVDEAIKKAEAKLEEDIYTEASVKAVEEAINAVVRDLDITKQGEVDAMATAIEEAIANLQEKPEEPKPADKSELEEVMKEAEELNAEDYTKESYEVLVEALEAAKAVAKDKDATQEEVDAVLAKLTATIDGLQLVEPTDSDKPTIPEEDNKPNEDGEGPDSGDNTNVGGLLTLLGLAGVAIAYETRKRMR